MIFKYSKLIVSALLLSAIWSGSQSFAKSDDTSIYNEDIKVRTELGFNSDSNFIKDINNNIKYKDKKKYYGIALTDEEEADLNKRQKQIDEAGKIKEDVQIKYSDSYGGMYFEHLKNNGTLRIATTKKGSHAELEKEIKSSHLDQEKVEFYYVDLSYQQLLELQKKINTYLFDNYKEIVAYTNIDEQENKVIVALYDHDNNVESRLNNTIDSKSFRIETVKRQDVKETALRGGDQISNNIGDCTGAFSAKLGVNYYFITAAHCFQMGDTVTSNGTQIGTVTQRSLPATAHYQKKTDSEGISISASNASSYVTTNQFGANKYNAVMNAGGEVVGTFVCKTGISTGVTCGTITGTNAYQIIGYWVGPLTSTSVSATFGDSGGPLYSTVFSNSTFTTTLFGVLHGKQGPETVYSKAAYVLSELGFLNAILN